MVAAVTAAARATAPAGMTHLARREIVGSAFIINLTRPRAGRPHGLVPWAVIGPAWTPAALVREAWSPSGPVWARPARLNRPARARYAPSCRTPPERTL